MENLLEMRDSISLFLRKQEELYMKTFGTYPTVSWDDSLPQDLFVGTIDDDGEKQWRPQIADQVSFRSLCSELNSFYSTFYYWEMRGEYRGFLFDFPPVPTSFDRKKVVEIAEIDGNYYFPNQNILLLATCSKAGNDDFLLFYQQKSGEMFVYDADQQVVYPLEITLVDLIGSMEAVI